jgi:OFA family oxalate/formate antiporter-like MFS transporter
MIFANKLAKKIKATILGYFSGLLFLFGYLLAALSNGNFLVITVGISLLAGIGTGLGYWVSLTIPVQWFPQRKGLITGIAAAGFGLGAFALSLVSEFILSKGATIFEMFAFVGLAYGLLIVFMSNFIHQPIINTKLEQEEQNKFLSSPPFLMLFIGIFLGTFSGLLIIGNLKLIGEHNIISNHSLILGISLFAVANFLGRLIWGLLSDFFSATLTIFFALMLQSVSIILLNIILLNNTSYLILSVVIGFTFGANFVLFAKKTAQIFGLANLGKVYPYVFLGYAIAGIAGPLSGGLLFDNFHEYTYSILLAGIVSVSGSLLYLIYFLKNPQRN